MVNTFFYSLLLFEGSEMTLMYKLQQKTNHFNQNYYVCSAQIGKKLSR
jgi:hypothetical protein